MNSPFKGGETKSRPHSLICTAPRDIFLLISVGSSYHPSVSLNLNGTVTNADTDSPWYSGLGNSS